MKKLLLALSLLLSVTTFAQNANVQFLHNCPDTAAKFIDVYVDGTLLPALTSLQFRHATAFTPVPVGSSHTIDIRKKNSTISDPVLYTATYPSGTLLQDSNYILVATGVFGSGYAANPNAISTGLSLQVIQFVKTSSAAGTISLGAIDGSTDEVAVDLNVRNTTPVVAFFDSLKYTDTRAYKTTGANAYQFNMNAKGTGTILKTYLADFTGEGGKAGLLFLSGFNSPSNNNGGSALGAFVAFADGNVMQLPERTNAFGQIIHNVPDSIASTFDIWLDNGLAPTKFLANIPYRSSLTAPLPAGFPLKLWLASKNSITVGDSLGNSITINMVAGQNYVFMAVGVKDTTGFAKNPNGRDIKFKLVQVANVRNTSNTTGNFDFVVIHGSTDAPTVDVNVRGGASNPLVNDLAYGDVTPYFSLPATSTIFDVKDGTGSVSLASYLADFAGLSSSYTAGVIFASGFVDPTKNKGGSSFGLFLAPPSGVVIALPLYTGIKTVDAESFNLKMFPNPATNNLTIRFDAKQSGNTRIEFVDMQGRIVKTILDGMLNAGSQTLNVNISDMNAGIYLAKISTASEQTTFKFVVE